ncbi:MAG: cation-translocating P-type ATPase [archaeon]
MNWCSKSLEEVFSELNTSEEGLSEEEAEKRLKEVGENKIKQSKMNSPFKILLDQFKDKLIYLLMAAAALSIVVGLLPGQTPHYLEISIIFIIMIGNGFFGFVQDYKAEKAIDALEEMSSPDVKVTRNGKKMKINSKEIVPGDIIHLEQGDAVPADARVIETESMATDESDLTGESISVSKVPCTLEEDTPVADRKNMIFKNTHILKGRAKAVVIGTGMDTEVGNIAKRIQGIKKRKTPFQREVDEMGKKISYLVAGIILTVAIMQYTLTGASLITIILMAISLSIAAIPESLPAIVTFTMALGSRRMLKKNALVRRLSVVEALGSVNFIVTDKTGTLTEALMTVEKIYFQGKEYEVTNTGKETNGKFINNGEEVDANELKPILECGVHCNNVEEIETDSGTEFHGSPTEEALIISGRKGGIEEKKERLRSIPFSSHRKRMTVITEDKTAYMKGAPKIILDRCNKILVDGEIKELTEERKQKIIGKNKEYAKEALRLLAFAKKKVNDIEASDERIENEMIFLGLQGMIDPPRKEVKEAIKDCRNAGIEVVMATGDNVETAKAIGEELGFNSEKVITGIEMDKMNEEELEEKVKKVEIFARITPDNKVMILEALKKQDMNVAMTGDGVNDAPALKDADVGISMGLRGTDVAKKASDMILQDDNFTTIRDAISEGRAIFDNIRKVTNQLLSTNSGEVMFVFLGTLIAGLFYPEYFTSTKAVILTAVMILWVNFISDGPPAIALGEDPKVKGIMKRKPRGREEPIMDKKIMAMIAGTGPIAAISMLPIFFIHIENIILAQTMLFVALGLFEIMMFQIIRNDYDLKLTENKHLIAAMSIAVISYPLLLYTPLSRTFGVTSLAINHWGYILLSLIIFMVIEILYAKLISMIYGKRIHEQN